MLQEIFTLMVESFPTQYYINFEKDRKKFFFQPTLKNKSAPSFTIVVKGNDMIVQQLDDNSIGEQAKEKVREIVSNTIYDSFK